MDERKQLILDAAFPSDRIDFNAEGGPSFAQFKSLPEPIRQIITDECERFSLIRVFRRRLDSQNFDYYVVGVMGGKYYPLSENISGDLPQVVMERAKGQATQSPYLITTNTMVALYATMLALGIIGILAGMIMLWSFHIWQGWIALFAGAGLIYCSAGWPPLHRYAKMRRILLALYGEATGEKAQEEPSAGV